MVLGVICPNCGCRAVKSINVDSVLSTTINILKKIIGIKEYTSEKSKEKNIKLETKYFCPMCRKYFYKSSGIQY